MYQVGINYYAERDATIGDITNNDEKITEIMAGAGGGRVSSGSGYGERDLQFVVDERLDDPKKLLSRLRKAVPTIVHMNFCEFSEDDEGNIMTFNDIYTWMDRDYEEALQASE